MHIVQSNADTSAIRFVARIADRQVGSLHLNPDTGEILWVGVNSKFRNRGIARALFTHATARGFHPKHSPCRSPEGDAWAHRVGGILPPLHSLPCTKCGEFPPET